jgi:hypothetical protein
MTDLEQAAALLEVDAKFFQPFDANDPFNDDARLEGFLCQKPNHTYRYHGPRLCGPCAVGE